MAKEEVKYALQFHVVTYVLSRFKKVVFIKQSDISYFQLYNTTQLLFDI